MRSKTQMNGFISAKRAHCSVRATQIAVCFGKQVFCVGLSSQLEEIYRRHSLDKLQDIFLKQGQKNRLCLQLVFFLKKIRTKFFYSRRFKIEFCRYIPIRKYDNMTQLSETGVSLQTKRLELSATFLGGKILQPSAAKT